MYYMTVTEVPEYDTITLTSFPPKKGARVLLLYTYVETIYGE